MSYQIQVWNWIQNFFYEKYHNNVNSVPPDMRETWAISWLRFIDDFMISTSNKIKNLQEYQKNRVWYEIETAFITEFETSWFKQTPQQAANNPKEKNLRDILTRDFAGQQALQLKKDIIKKYQQQDKKLDLPDDVDYVDAVGPGGGGADVKKLVLPAVLIYFLMS